MKLARFSVLAFVGLALSLFPHAAAQWDSCAPVAGGSVCEDTEIGPFGQYAAAGVFGVCAAEGACVDGWTGASDWVPFGVAGCAYFSQLNVQCATAGTWGVVTYDDSGAHEVVAAPLPAGCSSVLDHLTLCSYGYGRATVEMLIDSEEVAPCDAGGPCALLRSDLILYDGYSSDGGTGYGVGWRDLAWCVPVDAPFACGDL